MKKLFFVLALGILAITLTACTAKGEKVDQTATIKTNRGDIVINLDAKAAPKTVENFVKKSESKEYDGRIFHRVEDWVVQGGDPDGNGTGGGDQATELSDRDFVEGAVGIARGGDIKISNADQFFFCTKNCSFLNKQYTYFGLVTSGMDIVKKIEIGDKINSIEIK